MERAVGNNKFHEAINLPNLMIWLTCCITLMCHGPTCHFKGMCLYDVNGFPQVD